MNSQYFIQQMKVLVFYSNQITPQEVAELSNELAQRLMDLYVRSEPIQKLPQTLQRLDPSLTCAVIVMTKGVQSLPPAYTDSLARLQGTNVAVIMYPNSISNQNPSAIVAQNKWEVFQAVAKQWTKETVSTPQTNTKPPQEFKPGSGIVPQLQTPFTVYTLNSQDQLFNSMVSQLGQKYKDKGAQFRNIDSVQNIILNPGERPMLVVSGSDVPKVLPQLSRYPMRNSLFTAVLSPKQQDPAWNNEFSVVATSPEQIENELDGVLQRMFIAKKVGSAGQKSDQQGPQLQPGAPIIQTVNFAQVGGPHMVRGEGQRATSAPQAIIRQGDPHISVMAQPFVSKVVAATVPGPVMIEERPRTPSQNSMTGASQLRVQAPIQVPVQVPFQAPVPAPIQNTYNSYYASNPNPISRTVVQQTQQQRTVTTAVQPKPTTSHMVTTTIQPLTNSRVGGRPVSADYRIRMQSAKRYKKNQNGQYADRQPTVYALESADPRFNAQIQSLGILPAFHFVRAIAPGNKFPPRSILICPYERKRQVVNALADGINKDLSCLFFAENLIPDPVMMNHPLIELATNRLDQVGEYLRNRGIKMTPALITPPGSVTSITVNQQKQQQIIPVAAPHLTSVSFGSKSHSQLLVKPVTPTPSQRPNSQIRYNSGIVIGPGGSPSNSHSHISIPPPPQQQSGYVSVLGLPGQPGPPVPIGSFVNGPKHDNPSQLAQRFVMQQFQGMSDPTQRPNSAQPNLNQYQSMLPQGRPQLTDPQFASQFKPQLQIKPTSPRGPSSFQPPQGVPRVQSSQLIQNPGSQQSMNANRQKKSGKQPFRIEAGDHDSEHNITKQSIIYEKLDPSIRNSMTNSAPKRNSDNIVNSNGFSDLRKNQYIRTQSMSSEADQQKKRQIIRKISEGYEVQSQSADQQKKRLLRKISDGSKVRPQQAEEQKRDLLKKIFEGYEQERQQAEQKKRELLKKIEEAYRSQPTEANQEKKRLLKKIIEGYDAQIDYAEVEKKRILKQIIQKEGAMNEAAAVQQKKKLLKKIIDGYEAMELDELQKASQQKKQILKKIADAYKANASKQQNQQEAYQKKKEVLNKVTDAFRANMTPEELQAEADMKKKGVIKKIEQGYGINEQIQNPAPMGGKSTKTEEQAGVGSSLMSGSEYTSSQIDVKDEPGSRFRRARKKKKHHHNSHGTLPSQSHEFRLPSQEYLPQIPQSKVAQDNIQPILNQQQFVCTPTSPLLPPICYFTTKHNVPKPHTHTYSVPTKVLKSHSSKQEKVPSNLLGHTDKGETIFETFEPPLLAPQQLPQVLGQRIIKDSMEAPQVDGTKIITMPCFNTKFQTIIYGQVPLVFQAKGTQMALPPIQTDSPFWFPEAPLESFGNPWLPKRRSSKGQESESPKMPPFGTIPFQRTEQPSFPAQVHNTGQLLNFSRQKKQQVRQPQGQSTQINSGQIVPQQQNQPFSNPEIKKRESLNPPKSAPVTSGSSILNRPLPQAPLPPQPQLPQQPQHIPQASNLSQITPQPQTPFQQPQPQPPQVQSSVLTQILPHPQVSKTQPTAHNPFATVVQQQIFQYVSQVTQLPTTQESAFNKKVIIHVPQSQTSPNPSTQPSSSQTLVYPPQGITQAQAKASQARQQQPSNLVQPVAQAPASVISSVLTPIPQQPQYLPSPLINQTQQAQVTPQPLPQQHAHYTPQSPPQFIPQSPPHQQQISQLPVQQPPNQFPLTQSITVNNAPPVSPPISQVESGYGRTIYGGSTYTQPSRIPTKDIPSSPQPIPIAGSLDNRALLASTGKTPTEATSVDNSTAFHTIPQSNRLTIQSSNLRRSRAGRILTPGMSSDNYDVRVENGVTIYSRKSKDRTHSVEHYRSPDVKEVRHTAGPYIHVPEYVHPTPAQQYGYQNLQQTNKPKQPSIVRSASVHQISQPNKVQSSEYEEVQNSKRIQIGKAQEIINFNQQSRTRSEEAGLAKESRASADNLLKRKVGGVLYVCPYNKDSVRRALYNIATASDKIQYYLTDNDIKKINMESYDQVFIFPIDQEKPPQKLTTNAYLVRMNSLSKGPQDIVIKDVNELKSRDFTSSALQIQRHVQQKIINVHNEYEQPGFEMMARNEFLDDGHIEIGEEYFQISKHGRKLRRSRQYIAEIQHEEPQMEMLAEHSDEDSQFRMLPREQERYMTMQSGGVATAIRRVYKERTYLRPLQLQQQQVVKLKVFFSFDDPEVAEQLRREVGDKAELIKYYDFNNILEKTEENKDGFILYILGRDLYGHIDDLKQNHAFSKFLIYDREGIQDLDNRDPDTIQAPTIDAVIDIVRSMI